MIQPYIGAGPAVIHARTDEVRSGGTPILTATSLGLSGVGGFRLKFSEGIGVFFEYKHIRANLEFGSVEGNAVVHAGVGGINFTF